MDDSYDPTVIVKSQKELKRFLQQERSIETQDRHRNGIGSSPKLKLDFSGPADPFSDTGSFNFGDMEPSNGALFARKHQQNIAGFDITKKIREKDREIIEGKTTISVLQSKLQNSEATLKKSRIQHDGEIESFRKKQMTDKEVIEELEQKVKQMQSKEREVKEDTLRARKLSESVCSQMGKKMLHLQTAHLEKSEQLVEELSHQRERVTQLEKETSEKSSSLQLNELQKKDLEEKLASMHERLVGSREMQLNIETLELKLAKANLKNKELEIRMEGLQEQESRCNLFENTMRQLPTLQKQLHKLKEENNVHKMTCINVGLLEERLAAAESQLKLYENRCNDLTAENATMVTLRDLSEQYEAVLRKELQLEYLPPVSDLVDILRALKKKDEDVNHSLSELKASLESHSSSKDMQEELVKKLTEEVDKNRLDLTKNTQIIRRLQRKVFLLSKERDNLTGIISSYESEATLNPSLLEQERISHLDAQLSSYKAEVTKLEEELSEVQRIEKYKPKSAVKNSSEEAEKTKKSKLHEMEKTLAKLSKENEHLKMQLEDHGIKGSYDPSQTKVLHLKNNPLEKAYQDRKAEFELVTQENEALKQRVKLLEEGDTKDLTQKVGLKVDTEGVSSKLVQDLEEKLTTLETRNKRLMEVFKLKSQEMREVVHRLTGYRVDMRDDNRYRLSNMYSESQEDYLMFEQNAKAELRLMETHFSTTLEDLIDLYLHQHDSFPAFLSALTLDLFGRQNQSCSSEPEDDLEDLEGVEEEPDEDEEMGEEEDDEDVAEEEEEDDEEEDDDDDDEEEEEEGAEEEDEEDEEGGPPPSKRTKKDEDDDDDDDELICLD